MVLIPGKIKVHATSFQGEIETVASSCRSRIFILRKDFSPSFILIVLTRGNHDFCRRSYGKPGSLPIVCS